MIPSPRERRPAGEPERAIPIAVSMGDPAGIGPDIALMSWRERSRHGLPPFVLYGDPDVLAQRARALGLAVPIATIASLAEAAAAFAGALPVWPLPIGAAVTGGTDAAIVAAIEAAAAAVAVGEALALVTNPIVKRTLDLAQLPYPGHTEFLAELALRHGAISRPRPVMMLVADELKVVPATVHIPLSAVPAALTRGLLVETIRITAAALTQDFGIAGPRIAVAGLNPHAGEGGLIGSEEADVIGPAIAELAAEGLTVSGPYSADTLFHAEARSTYDAVVAMYHDQALIPIKTLAFDRGVNVTLGLPFVRTSPDHGTAFALAGTGKARPGSFIAALRLAAELGTRRAAARARPAPMTRERAAAGPDGLPSLGEVIRDLGLSARRSLGQNFILDLNLTRRIARSAGPLEGKTVVEVGPGPGGLTRALFLEGAERVVAVERDERCRPALEAITERYPGRLEVHYGDALQADWHALAGGSGVKPIIAANLPYNVATVLLIGWLESDPWPPWYARMVLMFQREVAERIVAAPASKAYGRLAVIAQWRTRPRLLFGVNPEAFTPAPSVASAIVEFTPIDSPSPECRVETLGAVTAAAFGQRRKMLRQSLRSLTANPEALLAAAGIAPTLRAEALAVRDLARLAYVFERMAK